MIEDLDDVETNLRLLSSNQQEGNDPLDIGLNALDTTSKGKHESDLSLSAYALKLGKSNGFITQVTQAATVYREIFTQVKNSDFEGRYKHLYEIHAAPHWLWVALVKQMIESGWTVQVTRDKVGAFKEVADPGR